MSSFVHQPVLLHETIAELVTKKDGLYVDCTLGGGGHTEAILKSCPEARVIGIDQDREALRASAERLAPFGDRAVFVWNNFSQLGKILDELGVEKADGFLFDLGISSPQLDNGERGFSYQHDAPLDMRMNRDKEQVTAKDIVNRYSEEEIAEIIFRYGEERWAKRIAAFIVERRKEKPLETTGELVSVIKAAIPKKVREDGHHPAKKTFQALRIAVNDELNIIAPAMECAAEHLNPGGKLAVISFHSLEDRIVKETMKYLATDCVCPPHQVICTCDKEKLIKVTVRKPICASEEELKENPRARSAKLRVGMRI